METYHGSHNEPVLQSKDAKDPSPTPAPQRHGHNRKRKRDSSGWCYRLSIPLGWIRERRRWSHCRRVRHGLAGTGSDVLSECPSGPHLVFFSVSSPPFFSAVSASARCPDAAMPELVRQERDTGPHSLVVVNLGLNQTALA